jgi:AbiTii-like protein
MIPENFQNIDAREEIFRGGGTDNVLKPILVPNAEIKNALSTMMLPYPIAQIESFAEESKTGTILLTFDERTTAVIRQATQEPRMEPFLEHTRTAFVGIIEAVRNTLLDLVLELRTRFPKLKVKAITHKERRKVTPVVTQIIHNPVESTIIGQQQLALPWDEFIAGVQSELKEIGAPPEVSAQLAELLKEAHKEAKTTGKQTSLKRVFEYMERNKQWLAETAINLVKTFLPPT